MNKLRIVRQATTIILMSDGMDSESVIENSHCIADLLQAAHSRLKNISHSPSLDADILLSHVLDVDRSFLKAWSDHPVDNEKSELFLKLIKQRETGKPIAYILGSKSFWTLEIDVNEHTLVPRPETELLVEHALKLISPESKLKIADVCTGSGAIALAIASERPDVIMHATDIDPEALCLARKTLNRLKLRNVTFYDGNLYSALPEKNYDIIISNPPYVDKNDPHLLHPTMQHEPRHALVADKHGLAVIEDLITDAKLYLNKAGYLIIEHGHDQAEAIRDLAKTHKLEHLLCCQDFQALDRMSILQNK